MEVLNEKIMKKTHRPVKILQFGEGNFLRAFIDWFIQTIDNKTDFNGGVAVVQPLAHGRVRDLEAQDGLYTLLLEGVQNGEVIRHRELIDVLEDYIDPYTQYDKFLSYAKSEDLKITISNTTEAGIAYDPTDLDFEHTPKSYPGKLLALLKARYDHFRGAKEAGIKRVRIHDLRHSHISLLIEMGFSAVAIADRVGHERIWRKKKMSAKVKDDHNRWRNKTVAFRMSPEEAEKLDRFVRISGLKKQEYLIKRALQEEIVVSGSVRTYKMLRNELREVIKELKRIETGQSVDDDLLDVIRQINTTLYGMKEDSE